MKILDEIFKATQYAPVLKGNSVWIKCPFHANGQERTPSCRINLEKGKYPIGFFYCFDESTEVLTRQGTFAIKDLLGKQVEVLDGNSNWVKTEFVDCGKQELYELKLQKDFSYKTILTTKEHGWFLRDSNVKKATTELKNGNYLAVRFPQEINNISPDIEGIRHGYLFGDGTRGYKTYDLIHLWFSNAGKMDMLRFFKDYKEYKSSLSKLFKITHPAGMSYKDLPQLNCSDSYALGFIMGYFAADGCCSKKSNGSISISCKDKKPLKIFRDFANRFGICTTPIKCLKHFSNYTNKEASYYTISILRSSVREDFFLREDQRNNFRELKRAKYKRARWKVISVKPTGIFKKVYCCDVETTHSFVLADYILTSNCFGCSKHGTWNDLAEKLHLAKIEEDEQELQPSTLSKTKLDALFEDEVKTPSFDMSLAVDFETNEMWRGISGNVLNQIGAKLCPDLRFKDTFIYLPCIQLGKEVGNIKAVMERKPGQLGYINSSGEWAKKGLFPYDYTRNMMKTHNNILALVEGPRDALNLIQHGLPALAILGSQNWSKYKAELIELLNPSKLILMFDGDEAGNRAYEKVVDSFKLYNKNTLFRFNFDGGKDPADLSETDVKNLYSFLNT